MRYFNLAALNRDWAFFLDRRSSTVLRSCCLAFSLTSACRAAMAAAAACVLELILVRFSLERKIVVLSGVFCLLQLDGGGGGIHVFVDFYLGMVGGDAGDICM